MYTITKQFEFCAAHRLPHLPEGHKCRNLHGHNYVVEVVLDADELDERGFVVDYGDLGSVKDWIDHRLDHGVLVDHEDGELAQVVTLLGGKGYRLPVLSSAENLARFIYDTWRATYPALVGVRVSETPKTWGEYWAPKFALVHGRVKELSMVDEETEAIRRYEDV